MASVWQDYHRRTALVTEERGDDVRVVMSQASGVEVFQIPRAQFVEEFTELAHYDPAKAAKVFIRTARLTNITEEAMEELTKVTALTKREIGMAKKKLPAAKMGEGTPRTTKGKAAKGEPKERKQRTGTAAAMFRELIVDKGMTDSKQIFEKVHAAFPSTTPTAVGYYKWKFKKAGLTAA